MNDFPKVSIIMPFFNAEFYLRDAILSVTNQTWDNFELILIDDGSSDSSYDIAFEFKKLDSRIKIFKTINKGQCAATNYGVSNSTGDFIQFLDADDLLHEKKIETQIKYFYSNNLTNTDLMFGRFSDIGLNDPDKPHYHFRTTFDLICNCFSIYMIANSSFLATRELIIITGEYKQELTLDNNYEYFTRLILKSTGIHFVEDSKVSCRFVANSLSRRKDFISINSAYVARELGCEYILNKLNHDQQVQKAVVTCLTQFFLIHNNAPSKYFSKTNLFLAKYDINIKPNNILPMGKFKMLVNIFGLKVALKLKNAAVRALSFCMY